MNMKGKQIKLLKYNIGTRPYTGSPQSLQGKSGRSQEAQKGYTGQEGRLRPQGKTFPLHIRLWNDQATVSNVQVYESF